MPMRRQGQRHESGAGDPLGTDPMVEVPPESGSRPRPTPVHEPVTELMDLTSVDDGPFAGAAALLEDHEPGTAVRPRPQPPSGSLTTEPLPSLPADDDLPGVAVVPEGPSKTRWPPESGEAPRLALETWAGEATPAVTPMQVEEEIERIRRSMATEQLEAPREPVPSLPRARPSTDFRSLPSRWAAVAVLTTALLLGVALVMVWRA